MQYMHIDPVEALYMKKAMRNYYTSSLIHSRSSVGLWYRLQYRPKISENFVFTKEELIDPSMALELDKELLIKFPNKCSCHYAHDSSLQDAASPNSYY